MITPQIPTFYQLKEYAPDINAPTVRQVNHELLHFSNQSLPYFLNKVMHYFSEVTYQRAGILYGEYVLYNGLVLVREDGMCIKANMAWEDGWGANKVCDDLCATEGFNDIKNQILREWEQYIVVDTPVVISQPYKDSYYHSTFELAAKNRFFAAHPENTFLVPSLFMKHYFQKNLLAHTSHGRAFNVTDASVIRMKDPILSHEIMSEEGVRWIRGTMNISSRAGNRRIYLRRAPTTSHERRGGGICETPEFLDFIKEYEFEAVDFSDQQLSVEQQVRMLDNAGIILAPHGGAMTNLSYLNPPLRVIEIMGADTPRAMFMHIASMLAFHYFGVFSLKLDEQRDIVVDVDELREIMKQCLA